MTLTEENSPLVATTPIVGAQNRSAPVIVVGLPRSGSSFLAHVISQIEDWYVFDDLFLLRFVKSIGVEGGVNAEQLEKITSFLGWQLRARVRWPSFEPPRCTWEDVDQIEEAFLTTFRGTSPTWSQLLEEWMTRLARHHGCSRWGYKAPQDFMNVDELLECFPGVRFIFLCRDPRKVMVSKKYVHGEDGKPGEYHPLIYARYWRMAVESAHEIRDRIGDRILFLKFEDLISDANGQAVRVASFLGTTFSGDVQRSEGNSSFQTKGRKELTPSEVWICEKVAGLTMEKMGYALKAEKPRLRDSPDLLWTSVRFFLFQLRRFVVDGSGRQSILMFLRSLFRK